MTGHILTSHEFLELEKCMQDPIYFFENYIKIISLDKGLIPFKMFKKQKEMTKLIKKNRFSIIMASRQYGKSVTISAIALWYAIFNESYEICLLADQVDHAQDLLKDIKTMIDYLPDFLRPTNAENKLLEDNKKSIILNNESHIFGAATTPKSIRGKSINLLVCDEFSLVENNMAKDFIDNAFPTITSGKTTKVVLISTPKGLNHFWSIWTKSINKKNDFKPLRIDWDDRPDRDEKWKQQQIKNMGEVSWNQEFGNKFLGSSLTLVDYKILELLIPTDPIDYRFNDYFRIYEEPQENYEYVIGIDVAKVINKDRHAFQVLKIGRIFEQVAVFHTSEISYRNLSDFILRIAELYNKAYVIIERNDINQYIADELYWTYNYENIIFDPYTKKSEPGVLTTEKTKKLYLQLIKDYCESRRVEIKDGETIKELSTFVLKNETARNPSYGPDTSKDHDDLIMSLGLALFFVLTPFYVEMEGSDKKKEMFKLFQQLEDLMPPGFLDDYNFVSLDDIKKELMDLKPRNGLLIIDKDTGENVDSLEEQLKIYEFIDLNQNSYYINRNRLRNINYFKKE